MMKFFGRGHHPAVPETRENPEVRNRALSPAVVRVSHHSYGLRRVRFSRAGGMTLIELIVAITILMILTSAAVPIARVTIRRTKERELRRALWEMRDAIDRYKDAADRGAFQIKLGSEGYPPDLQTLVDGVDVSGKKVRFLRRIPADPMTGTTDWGKHCMSDDPDSTSWCGDNVFDVYTKYQGDALDGTKYAQW
jgi:general secretion pathway protein G